MRLLQNLYTWWFKPSRPIMRITKHSPTNYWMHTEAWGDEGRWATPEEIEDIEKTEAQSKEWHEH